MKKDDGPAFPGQSEMPDGNFPKGMSLRDWFAGQALVAIVDGDLPYKSETFAYLASTAYRLADAMLAARETERQP